jgi:hypothetical protein
VGVGQAGAGSREGTGLRFTIMFKDVAQSVYGFRLRGRVIAQHV